MEKRICKIHGEYEVRTVEAFGITYTLGCPQCEAIAEAQEKKDAERVEINYQNNKYRTYNIEPEFYSATFDNYRAATQSQKKALEAVQTLVQNKSGKVLLLGSNGVGKTHLACSALKILSGKIYTMYEISTLIRQSYSANSTTTELEIVDKLASYPLLCIDEVGRSKGSDTERNWLSYIIDKRHTRHLPLIIISNRKRASSLPRERQGEAIEYYFDNDIISRFRQNTEIVEIQGEDYRAQG